MATEQEKYRDWLKSQPPEEILHHTYEYTVREDIVMAMEELELTDAQAQALLEDVYKRQAEIHSVEVFPHRRFNGLLALAIYIVGSSVLLQLPMFSRIGS